MSGTHSGLFDKTIQQTDTWLKDVMDQLDLPDRHAAYRVLRATLHALRDRIGPENAVHLGAQLPTLIRGIYYEGWHMAATPSKERHKAPFLEHVRREVPREAELDVEAAVHTVFNVLCRHIDPGEAEKLVTLFPVELRDLWPSDFQQQPA